MSPGGDGVPDAPAMTYRRSRRETDYDDRGRVFQTRTFNVDQVTGARLPSELMPASLKTHSWYDPRSNLLKTAAPGGLVTKMQYDGAGRLTKTFLSDGGSDIAAGQAMTWSTPMMSSATSS